MFDIYKFEDIKQIYQVESEESFLAITFKERSCLLMQIHRRREMIDYILCLNDESIQLSNTDVLSVQTANEIVELNFLQDESSFMTEL